MAVLVSLAGNSAGDGFLIVPLGSTYDADLTLQTDAGTVAVTLQASPNAAGLVFSQTAVSLSTSPTVVQVHATAQSASRGDTTIQVLQGAIVVASFTVTAIKRPVVLFKGRFEARFATDTSFYNRNPIYTDVIDTVVPPGWTWGLEGEPSFVPTVGSIPENLETPVGRVVRYNNPVSLRSHAAPVTSAVHAISGVTTSGTEVFTTGDPLITQPVNLGPNTYLAGNNPANASEAKPEEWWDAALEPMALFELHLGNLFSGTSQIGPFVAKATGPNQHTRSPDSRPIANGLAGAAAELAEFALPNLTTFSETRIDQLVADYNALPAGASPQRRNLARRIGHLLLSVSTAKQAAVQAANPGAFTIRQATLTGGWPNKEVYTGMVDANLVFNPGGSSVVTYLSEFQLFKFESSMFAFHSDELCGHHKGTLAAHRLSNGFYTGDPHTQTVNGIAYDFQAVGEFTLLRDGSRMEIQVRQTPVAAANPVSDNYSGLTACVSVITAVAARVGAHRIALQPGQEGRRLEFYVDGKPTNLSPEGIDLDAHRVSAFDVSGETGLRVDYEDGTVLLVTPMFWSDHGVWYMNVSVANTPADEGIMGFIPAGSWLPRLRTGASVGPIPASLTDRHKTLYRTFADSWRVTDNTSLFVYRSGAATATFTDTHWPAEKPPCKLKAELRMPGVAVHKGMPVAEAEQICRIVTAKDLHRNCVFDVATTGNEIFAKGYGVAQELRLYGTSVQIGADAPPSRADRLPDTEEAPRHEVEQSSHSLIVTATVTALTPGRPVPTGTVAFIIDGIPMSRPVEVNARGVARLTLGPLKPGEHRISATYSGGGRYEYHASASRVLVHKVGRDVHHKCTTGWEAQATSAMSE